MADTVTPPVLTPSPKPPEKVNRIGLSVDAYKGGESTLCSGCGHDSITAQIIKAFYELGIPPHMVAKLSGIGCSSKTPAYFLNRAHGFNSVHGRMPAVATGTKLANRTLKLIGVSGDGDTASIGMGQFVHMVRRNTDIVYIIENNGVYGLTKGQFSATADMGSAQKKGEINEMIPIDCCGLAIELGCTFVARGFSADMKQLVSLLKIAINHKGTALIDVVSPCVTFNNHEGSTKSYKYAKDHEMALHEIDFIEHVDPQAPVEVKPGETREIEMHDGSRVRLKKLAEDYDPTSRELAVSTIERARRDQLFLTGLLYLDKTRRPFVEQLNLIEEPLATLPQERIRPAKNVLDEIMNTLK
ncbi:MAG TPA: 2-oxoacid:ferredoxin oxidoreductase subunit beta [Planctomycetota bacterium]|nr:2-oxoacid:ferredoxin oxidoreductase subunit beta [Planctomycetota bacterium]